MEFFNYLSQFILGAGLIGIVITEGINWIRNYWFNNFFKFSYLKEIEDIKSTARKHLDDVNENGLFDEVAKKIKHQRIPFVFLDYIINQLPYIIRKPNFFAGMVRLRHAILNYRECFDYIVQVEIGKGLTNESKETNEKFYVEKLERIIRECDIQFMLQEETNAIKINRFLNKLFQRRYSKLLKERYEILEKHRQQGKIDQATFDFIKKEFDVSKKL